MIWKAILLLSLVLSAGELNAKCPNCRNNVSVGVSVARSGRVGVGVSVARSGRVAKAAGKVRCSVKGRAQKRKACRGARKGKRRSARGMRQSIFPEGEGATLYDPSATPTLRESLPTLPRSKYV